MGLQCRDMIGLAETGSGKTCAFMIPIIEYILKLPAEFVERTPDEGPLAIIMAPTRELAQQIEGEGVKLLKYTKLKTVCVVGGQSIEDQGFKLRRGVAVVVGTPGRINDCIDSRLMVLNQCNYVVLDEADRMIDMGFEPQVVSVLDAMGGRLKDEDEQKAFEQEKKAAQDLASLNVRVTSMFSATMPAEVEKLAQNYLRHPAIVRIGEEKTTGNAKITQRIVWLPSEGKKKEGLLQVLRGGKAHDKIIVFVNEKKATSALARELEKNGYHPTTLHGGKKQEEREESLAGFKKGDYDILVATDVAGRGIDIPDVAHVINFDMPDKIDKYCHRIGRTGRAGKEGLATTLLTESSEEVFFDLKNYLEQTNTAVPHQLASHPAAKVAPGTRDDRGNVMGMKRDKVQFSSR
jgi:ATP-dependent RNA helicase DDX23/PRP28